MNRKREINIKFIKKVKIKKVIINILYVFFVLGIILNILFLLNTIIKKQDYFDLMGISLLSMKSDSMNEEIPKNSLIIARKYNSNEIGEKNDNIAYVVNKKIRINKIVTVKSNNGKIEYTTKSNNNYLVDVEKIAKNQIIGKVICVIPEFGIVLNILQSKITTLVIIIILVIKLLYNKKIYRRRIKKNKTLRKTSQIYKKIKQNDKYIMK